MLKFKTIFTQKTCSIIGMLHINPLPGTPNYVGSFENIVEKAKYEANVFKKSGIVSWTYQKFPKVIMNLPFLGFSAD